MYLASEIGIGRQHQLGERYFGGLWMDEFHELWLLYGVIS